MLATWCTSRAMWRRLLATPGSSLTPVTRCLRSRGWTSFPIQPMSKPSSGLHADSGFFRPDRQIQASGAFSTQRLLKNDELLAGLYEEYGGRLYRYAVLLLADRVAAEDVV